MSVFWIGNIDIRDFEKYRYSGYLENAAETITEYGGRYRVRGGQTTIIEGQLVLHRLVVIEFPSMESFEIGIPPMLMPLGKKSDRNFLKPIFLLWKVWPRKNQKKSPTQPELQEIHYYSHRFQNWGIIRKKTWLPRFRLYSEVKTIAAKSLQNGLKKTSRMQWKLCLFIPQTENKSA